MIRKEKNDMREQFDKPEIDKIFFGEADIITTSDVGDGNEEEQEQD